MAQATKNLSRRFVLSAIPAVAVAAAMPSVALATAPRETELLAQLPELKRVWHLLGDALGVHSEAENRYFARRKSGISKATDLALREEAGLTATAAAVAKIDNEWDGLAMAFLATPARTIEGMRLKSQVTEQLVSAEALLDALLDDLSVIGGPIAYWYDAKTVV